MDEKARRFSGERRILQFAAAGIATLFGLGLALSGVWVFRAHATQMSGSVWRLLLSDRTTVGFLRLALIVAALYVVASIAALAVNGRWIRVFGASGFEADAVPNPDEVIAELRDRLDRAEQALDEFIALSEE